MTRFLVSLCVVILAVACGAEGTTEASSGPATRVESTVPGTEAPAPSASEVTATTPDVATTVEPGSEGQPLADAAPEFSLALGDGGTFVLSQATKPVFLVFWAEW